MGNNAAYAQCEEIVVSLYDLDKIDVKSLPVILKAFADYDVDSGGEEGLTSEKDGKTFVEIVVSTMKPDFKILTNNEYDALSDEESYEYSDRLHETFDEIMGW